MATVLKEWLLYYEENKINSEFIYPNTKTGGMRTYSGLGSLLKMFIKNHNPEDGNIILYKFRHPYGAQALKSD